MTTKHPTYHIKTIADLLTIPDDRLDDCLKELPEFLKTVKAVKGLADAIANVHGVKNSEVIGFTWIDDGKTNKTIKICPEEEVKCTK